MKSNRTFSQKCMSIVLMAMLAFLPMLTAGCNADQVVAGLQTADDVAVSAASILAPVNAPMASALSRVDVDLKTVIKAYQDYDNAVPADKATKADLVKATAATIRGNLSAILADVGIKNPGLLRDVNIAVAVVNSALVITLSRVNGTVAQAALIGAPDLPVVVGAKSAKDLKKAWNDAIKADFPKAKI